MTIEELLKKLESGPVSVTTEELIDLKEEAQTALGNELWINALEAAGVDNWDGYGDAQDINKDYRKENGLED